MTQLEKKKITKKIKGLAEEEAEFVDDKAINRQIESLYDGLISGLDRDAICGSGRDVIKLGLLTRNQRSEKARAHLDKLANFCYKPA